jgi:hypothetical protein
MEWWFVYGDRLYQQYRNERLRQAQKGVLIKVARGQSSAKGMGLDLLMFILVFVNFHIH